MTRTRVNITTKVNAKAIRREKLEGEDYIVVPSATLPDDVVMNGVLYPADEIAKSFMTLENTFAPFGHPDKGGTFLNANDPIAIDRFHIGAHNRNVRREGGRVHLDKYIHVATAQNSERGKRVLDAIEKGEPIHTSTGLYAIMENANGEVPYSRIARDIIFDHDAILLDEEGAATPEQGVGMLVNSKGEKEQVPVINSTFEDDADREIDWALTSLAQAVQRKKDASMLGKLKTAILGLITGAERETPTNSNKEADDMSEVTKKDFDALAGEVKTLSDSLPKLLAEAVNTAVKPINDHVEALANSQKAKDEAELTDLRKKIVEAGTLTEAAANALTSLDVARELAPKAPGAAAALNGAFNGKKDDKGGAYQLPADEE
jgi:hypothetical protein